MNAELNALIEATERVLEHAQANKKDIDGPINWGDLHCVSAERYYNHNDETGLRVFIEEAAPDNCELEEFVREGLAKLGYKNVIVMCEW